MQNWIEEHIDDDPAALRLKYAGKTGAFDYAQAIVQIECRRRFGSKLRRTLASIPGFMFASALAGEQASSDILAAFHATLCKGACTAVDLTAGLGIDALTLAHTGVGVTAIERNELLADTLRYNAAQAGLEKRMTVINADCRDFAAHCTQHFDVAFIDPARRADDGSRIFALGQCSPDVVAMLPELLRIASRVIIKASPMLDISAVLNSLPVVPERVIAAGTPTECKELIIVINQPATAETIIGAVALSENSSQTFDYRQGEETAAPWPEFGMPKAGDYILEPYPAVMKTGAFRLLCERYALKMMNPNTALLYCATVPDHFPGFVMPVEAVEPFSSSVLKRLRKAKEPMEIAVRNFGMTAAALRAKIGAPEGGTRRMYGVTARDNTRLLIFTGCKICTC